MVCIWTYSRLSIIFHQNALHTLSDPCLVASGIPQGSVMGPIFFIILNHLVLSTHTTQKFLVPNLLIEYNQLRSDLRELTKWCEEWLIHLNPNKSTILLTGVNNPTLQYYIGDVTINIKLNWSEHIFNCQES